MNRIARAMGVSLLIILLLPSCGRQPTYRKGELQIKILKAEWNYINAGPFRVQDGALIVALQVNYPVSAGMPDLKMSIRTASGRLVKQGTTESRSKGGTARVETFFLVSKEDAPLDLVLDDFDPIRLAPVNKLK